MMLKITNIRKKLGLTQEQMANLLNSGNKTYCRWENGTSIQTKSMDNLIRYTVEKEISTLKKRERVFLVSDKESLKGIVCLEDVKSTPSEKWPETRVEEIMTPKEKLEAVSPDADGNQVLNSITTKDIHQIPVMEGEKIAGIICRSDVLRFIQLRSELGV